MKMLLKQNRLWLSSLVISLSVLSTAQASEQSPEEKGLAIAQERKLRDEGWNDTQSTSKMILRNKQGQESIREMRLKSLEVDGDGDKSLTVFDRPRDVKGTAFLSFSHAIVPDEQWLYMPALKRVKRISSKNKSGPFMGSEFSYEDLSSFEIEKYSFKYLKDEACGESTCFVVESYPTYKHSGYKRQISWIDQNEYRVQKIEFYDRKDSKLKTLNFNDYRQYKDKFWRSHKMEMVNHQTGKSTDFITEEIIFGAGLNDKDFSKNSLKRAR